MMDGNPHGTQKHGRPRITWHRSIQKALMEANFSWCKARSVAQDPQMWKATIWLHHAPMGQRGPDEDDDTVLI